LWPENMQESIEIETTIENKGLRKRQDAASTAF
jgi:hypothetical protein